jgi:DNA modification methylase
MDWRHLEELSAGARSVYSELKNVCVWVKNSAGMGSFYRSQHELVFVFKKGTKKHRNNIQLGRFGRDRTNVWRYPSASAFSRSGDEGNLLSIHPTVKPVNLVADAIADCSRRGDVVLDPFLGSGTTVIAAERTGRLCYGIEFEPAYVDAAIRRWQTHARANALHAITGRTFSETERAVAQ